MSVSRKRREADAPRTLGQKAADRARRKLRGLTHPFRCDHCNKDFRIRRGLNAHHMSRHAQRWTSKKARAAARAMGKDVDLMRRHAAGWLEAAGLRDARGRGTDRSRSRPQVRGKVSLREMRRLHKHDKHHERAVKSDSKAARARGRDFHAKAGTHERKAATMRDRWPVRPRQPRSAPPPRTAPASSNGHRPAPARTRTP